jgi:chemotaxis-related protein WspD
MSETPTHEISVSPVDLLLHRTSPPDYVQAWETSLGREKDTHERSPHHAIVIFVLGGEHLALSSLVVGQITMMRRVHRVPHTKSPVIRGVVNINGRLRIFISLGALLEIGGKSRSSGPHEAFIDFPMIMIEQNSEVWTFAVDKILGVFHCDLNDLKNVPVTVAKSAANYVKGVLNWRDKQVALLDEELLFFSLRRNL